MRINRASPETTADLGLELVDLFQEAWQEHKVYEGSVNSVDAELRKRISNLAGRKIIAYSLGPDCRPIESVYANNHGHTTSNAETHISRPGYIKRELTDDGRLAIATAKCAAMEFFSVTRGMFYAVQVCEPSTGEPLVGLIKNSIVKVRGADIP